MSEQTKKTVEEIRRNFQRIAEDADNAFRKASPLDGGLAQKIKKVGDGSKEIVKHIEERVGK